MNPHDLDIVSIAEWGIPVSVILQTRIGDLAEYQGQGSVQNSAVENADLPSQISELPYLGLRTHRTLMGPIR